MVIIFICFKLLMSLDRFQIHNYFAIIRYTLENKYKKINCEIYMLYIFYIPQLPIDTKRKKEHTMKKKQITTLLLTSCLFLSACNTNTPPFSTNMPSIDTNKVTTTTEEHTEKITEKERTEENISVEDNTKENITNENITDESIDTDKKADDSPDDVTINETTQDTVLVTYEESSNDYNADNGDLIFSTKISFPVITINKNTEATQKINASIQEQLLVIQEDLEIEKDDAISFYEISENEETPSSSFSSCEYMEHRIDEKIISFQRNAYFFLGGAHGQSTSTGINYDTQTGNLLTLNDIFVEPDLAKEQIKNHLSNLASLPEYKELMYENMESEVTCLVEDGNWFFANDGIHFVAEPYLLGPYASGEINFTIPYQELPDLKIDYQYDAASIVQP